MPAIIGRVVGNPPDQFLEPLEGPEADAIEQAAHRSAADPTAILALIEERDRYRQELVALREWIAKQRGTPWAESGSFASRMTGEQGYDAALEELESRLG